MLHARRQLATLLDSLLLVGGLLPALAAAQDFHVSNKVYNLTEDPKKRAPVVSTTTLFWVGRAYDFVETPKGETMETMIIDQKNDLIIILDPDRKMKTEISTGDVAKQMGLLLATAQEPKQSEFIRFSAAPKFDETFDAKTRELLLSSKWMRYAVKTEAPKNPFAAKQYNEMADWMAQIKAVRAPGYPPFPRLKLNEVLKQRQEIPQSIEWTVIPEGRGKPQTLRSEHQVQWGLSATDKRRIEDVGVQLHTFNVVSFEAYHSPPGGDAGK